MTAIVTQRRRPSRKAPFEPTRRPHKYFLRPGNKLTNQMLASMLPEENFCERASTSRGEQPLWRVELEDINALRTSASKNTDILFAVFRQDADEHNIQFQLGGNMDDMELFK